MKKKYTLSMTPAARESAIVKGDKYRFTVLTVRITGCSGSVRVILEDCGETIARMDATGMIYHILSRAQLPYDLKREVFDTIQSEPDPVRLMGRLIAMQLPANLLDALTEQITASY